MSAILLFAALKIVRTDYEPTPEIGMACHLRIEESELLRN